MTTARDITSEIRELAARFNVLYYNLFGWGEKAFNWNSWRGVPVRKCPEDLWRLQDIIFRTQPDLIIETGVAHGGSTLWLADVCQMLGKGQVVACDIALGGVHELVHNHRRVTLIEGSSTSVWVESAMRERALGSNRRTHGKRVMVVLDSDHRKTHVLDELRIYGELVTPGCYMVVEDTNLNNNPAHASFGPGPHEALQEYLETHGHFWRRDLEIERSLLTFNPGGYLVKETIPCSLPGDQVDFPGR